MSVRAWLATELRAPHTRQTAVTLAGYVGRFSLTFGASVVVARSLGPAGYGLIAVVAAAFALADTFGDFGLTYAAVRAISRHLDSEPDRARRLAHGYLSLALLANAVAAAVGILLAEPIARLALGRPEAEPYVRLALLGLIPAAGSGFIMALLQSTRRFAALAALQIVAAASYLAGVSVLAVSGHLSIGWVVLLGVVNPILTFLVGRRLLPPGFVALRSAWAGPARRAWGELAGFSKWLWVSAILSLLASQLDLLLISHWAAAPVVGVYALAFNLALRLDIVNQARLTVLLPTVSTFRTRTEVGHYLRRTLVRSALLALPFGLAAPLAGPFVEIVYGPAYAGAVPVLLILLVAVVFDLVATPLTILALPLNAPKVLAISDVIRVATLALVGALLIPTLGPIGAALAKLAARVAGAAFTLAALWRTIDRGPWTMDDGR